MFYRPNLSEIIERVALDISSRTRPNGEVEQGSVEFTFAQAIAGCSHLLHAHLDHIANQILPITASGADLEKHASFWLKSGRKSAVKAVGMIEVQGKAGVIIPSGTFFQRADGTRYLATAETECTGDKQNIQVECEQEGQGGNAKADDVLNIQSPIFGVQSQAKVVNISGGADLESDEDLRLRILNRIQQPPHGGSKNDYVQWGLEVEGVSKVFVLPQLDLGVVRLAFLREYDEQIFPDEAERERFKQHIENVRPVTARVVVVPLQPQAVDFHIELSPNTPSIRSAAEQNLKAFFKSQAEPLKTIHLSQIQEVISLSLGEHHHRLLSPSTDQTAGETAILQVGTISWS